MRREKKKAEMPESAHLNSNPLAKHIQTTILSVENLRRGWGTHYHVHEVSKTFEERRKILEPVPGLRKGASIFQIEEGLREAMDIGSQDSITPASAGAGPKLKPWHDQEDELYPLHLFEVNYGSS